MTSPFDTLFEQTSKPALLALHGGTIEHRPNGLSEDSDDITAIFVPGDTETVDAGGRRYDQMAKLEVDDTLTVTTDDSFIINGETWYVDNIGKPCGGLKTVNLISSENESYTSERRTQHGHHGR